MEVGSTIPWKESVESSQEQRPRTTQETKSKSGGVWFNTEVLIAVGEK